MVVAGYLVFRNDNKQMFSIILWNPHDTSLLKNWNVFIMNKLLGIRFLVLSKENWLEQFY